MYSCQKCTTASTVSRTSSFPKKKKEQEKTSAQHLKLDMTSGIITADDPLIALWCQEGVGFLTSGPSQATVVLFGPELGNQHLHESPEVNNKWSYNLPAQDCHGLLLSVPFNTVLWNHLKIITVLYVYYGRLYPIWCYKSKYGKLAIEIGDCNTMETTLCFHAMNLRSSCPVDKHCRPYPYMNPILKKL